MSFVLRAAALLGAALLISPATVSAQALPFPETPRVSGDLSQHIAAVRDDLERVLGEIGGPAVGRAPEAVASYYGVEARFAPADGAATLGRDAIAERFEHGVPALAARPAEVSDLVAAGSLASSFVIVPRDPATPGPVVMEHILWRRVGGDWEIALHHAFGATAEPGSLIVPTGLRAPEPPGRLAPQTRYTLTPHFGFMGFDNRIHHASIATGGITGGVELGRAFELRGGYWQRLGQEENTQLRSGFSGDARLYLLPSFRLRPYISVGVFAARYDGWGTDGLVRDESLVPTAGGGIAFDAHRNLSIGINGTSHLFLDPARGPGDHWGENRTAGSILFSAQVALTMPGPTPRRQVRRPVLIQEYEASLFPLISRELQNTMAAIDRADATALASRLASTATLILPDGMLRRGQAQISESLLDHLGDRERLRFSTDDFGAAGNLAYVRGTVTAADGPTQRAFFAFTRDGGEWRIRQTVIVPGEVD